MRARAWLALALAGALGAACAPEAQRPATGPSPEQGAPAGTTPPEPGPSIAPLPPARSTPPATAPPPAGPGPAAPGFLGPEAVATWPGAAGEVATATALRAASHDGYDRVVLELDRHASYRVAWLDGPPVGCGSGEVVALPGEAFLEVRLEPAKAHDDAGALTLRTRELRPALPAVRALVLTCDFEAVLTFAAGAPQRLPFRVSRLERPPRLVLDVAHPSAARAAPASPTNP